MAAKYIVVKISVRGMKNPSKVGGPTNELAIHSHAMDVRVPDIMEMEQELGLATSNFGGAPKPRSC